MTGARAAFSNFGSYISLAAPGQQVFGAISGDADPATWTATALPGSAAGLYGYGSRTSFASPEVAGAAALVWAANPALSAKDVAAILKQTAAGNNGIWNADTGYGVLDVAAAVERAGGVTTAAPPVTLTGTRTGARLTLSWSAPGAVSYRLAVSRDGGAADVLLGATTSTGADYDLTPGHTYSFTATAVDGYGLTGVSQPYLVALPQSATKLILRASPTVGRKRLNTVVWAVLTPADRQKARGGHTIILESFDGSRWRRFSHRAQTSSTGLASWRLRFRRGTYLIRARFAGTVDLAPATSAGVRIRVR